jgi:hypothetical protein
MLTDCSATIFGVGTDDTRFGQALLIIKLGSAAKLSIKILEEGDV